MTISSVPWSIRKPMMTEEKPPIKRPTLTIQLLAVVRISVGYKRLTMAP